MYIKWIVCNVAENFREEFSEAQEKWAKIKKANGFIAQVGGWNQKKKTEACIISFWENKESLDAFMKKMHNEILVESKQKQTYESISIRYFERESDEFNELDDLMRFEGKEVLLVNSWKVLK